jgi:uncharacterized membrane protein YvlD (DUF360 family)
MITALLLGLIKTAIQGVYLLLTTLLSAVFTNYTAVMATVTGSVITKIAAGIIDTVVGWSFFTDWVVLALVVLPLIRLAKYIIGFFTKG